MQQINSTSPRNRTFRSSSKLVRTLVRELRLISQNLDTAGNAEKALEIAQVLSESIKKVSSFLSETEPKNEARQSDPAQKINVGRLSKIFAALDNDGPLKCDCCGKIRTRA